MLGSATFMTPDDGNVGEQPGAGDDSAAAEFGQRYRDRLLHIVCARGLQIQDAEDVVQDVLLDAFRQLQRGQFRSESQISTWLFRIVQGKVADYWRRRGRQDRVFTQPPPQPNEGGPVPWLLGGSTSPNHDERLVIEQALAALPTRLAVILRLNVREGRTIEEIAIYLHRSPGRIGALLAEAKRRFRSFLAHPEEQRPRKRLIERKRS